VGQAIGTTITSPGDEGGLCRTTSVVSVEGIALRTHTATENTPNSSSIHPVHQ
jgi:hypothetical protein